MSSQVFWFGILGPAEDDAQRNVVLISWITETQAMKIPNADSKVLSSLNGVPFLKDDDTRVVCVGSARIVEYKPKDCAVSFAAMGEDELELEELLRAFSKSALASIDNLTSSSVRTSTSQGKFLCSLADEMVRQGQIERLDGDSALKQLKHMLATAPPGKIATEKQQQANSKPNNNTASSSSMRA